MKSTKKNLFRIIFIIILLTALTMIFETVQSAPLFSPVPLPTIQATLRPGIEWMTVRNLSVEASTIWQENGQVFGFSRPIINNPQDAFVYQELLKDRLNSLPDEQILTAEVTFKAPLTLSGIENLLSQYTIVSLLASGENGSTSQVAYPPESIPIEVQEEFNQTYEALSGGTPAPSLSPDSYIAATVKASPILLRELAQKERVFTVDVGPVDLISEFPTGNFSPLKDVSYDYELHVGASCEFNVLRDRINEFITNTEISETVGDELIDALNSSETYLNFNDIASSREELVYFFDILNENSTNISEAAFKEINIIADCLFSRKLQSNPVVYAGIDQSISLGNSLDMNVSYSDPDDTESHTAKINWGDGVIEDVPANRTGIGDGEVISAHTYNNLGAYTVEVCVTDLYGGIGCDTIIVNVTQQQFNFTGFFPPVDNQPILNTVKAGSAIPIKFSLNGNQGLDILFTGYPTSATVVCGSAVEDAIEQTVTAGESSLSYNVTNDQYTYVWKTNKSWANSCRTFVLRLSDGSYYRINFKFK